MTGIPVISTHLCKYTENLMNNNSEVLMVLQKGGYKLWKITKSDIQEKLQWEN